MLYHIDTQETYKRGRKAWPSIIKILAIGTGIVFVANLISINNLYLETTLKLGICCSFVVLLLVTKVFGDTEISYLATLIKGGINSRVG